jgi:CHAT domain-containing protein
MASELGKMLLNTAAGELSTKRLIIVSEGALQYIPFAALSLSDNEYAPLMLTHEIVNLPSASTLSAQRKEFKNRPSADKTLAVLADPVFEQDDPRIKQSIAKRREERGASVSTPAQEKTANTEVDKANMARSAEDTGVFRDGALSRLPGTRREANAISLLVEKESLLKALDFDASRDTAFSAQMGQYRYIHFATHGLLNPVHPELSGIVLALFDKDGQPQRGFLSLTDVFNLKLNADLVVLSACQTGLGKEVKGEGLVGLSRGFIYAGSKSLVTSLWKVDDFNTSELLANFYQAMIKNGKRPAEALRQAQISVWKKKPSSHPFYWAGFTFQGEWF